MLENMRFISAALILTSFTVSCTFQSSRQYLTKGDRLFSNQKYADALLIYRKAIQKDPKSSEAYYKLGLAQRATNSNAAALASFSKALALNPEMDAAQIELGNLYLGDYLVGRAKNPGVYRKISAIADQLLAKDAKSYAGLRFRGYLAIDDRKPTEAIAYFTRANEVRPMQADIVLELTQGLLMTGQYEQARNVALKFIEKEKGFGPVYDVLYGYDASMGRADAAESWLKIKIANNPGNQAFVLQLAQHYWNLQKTDPARNLVNETLNGQPPLDSYIHAADFFKRNKDLEWAMRILDGGLAAHPGEKLAFAKSKAGVLALRGNPREAVRIFDEVLQASPSAADARKARAVLLLDLPERTGKQLALEDLESLASQFPDDAEVAFQLGRAYALNGVPDKARQQFEFVLKKNQNSLPALLSLAEMASHARQFQQTLQFSERILASHPAQRNARLLHATALTGLGQLESARIGYTSLLRDEPDYTEAKLQLALLNLVQKRFSEAAKLFREVYRAKDGDFRAVKGLVEVYAAQGQLDAALDMLDKELHRSPDSISLLRLAGSTALSARKLDLAQRQYERVLQLQPDDLEASTQLGQISQRGHDLSKSIAMLQKARDLAPGDWRAAARLATVQQEAGLELEAKGNYSLALRLGCDDPDLFNNLAYLEAEIGSDLDNALKLAQTAISKSPANARYADTIGFVYLKMKDTGSALGVFQTLSKRHPEVAVFRYHLALALLQNGAKEEAKRQFQVAVASDPSLVTDPSIRGVLGKN
jgi:tetratricopeptide (TPR) repeat protein